MPAGTAEYSEREDREQTGDVYMQVQDSCNGGWPRAYNDIVTSNPVLD